MGIFISKYCDKMMKNNISEIRQKDIDKWEFHHQISGKNWLIAFIKSIFSNYNPKRGE